MTKLQTLSGRAPHSSIDKLCERVKKGEISRRDFMRTTAWLGISAASAGSFIGGFSSTPALAQETPVAGGVLRFGLQIQEITDPMTVNWIEASNLFRNCLEYLTYVDADNITRPYLAMPLPLRMSFSILNAGLRLIQPHQTKPLLPPLKRSKKLVIILFVSPYHAASPHCQSSFMPIPAPWCIVILSKMVGIGPKTLLVPARSDL